MTRPLILLNNVENHLDRDPFLPSLNDIRKTPFKKQIPQIKSLLHRFTATAAWWWSRSVVLVTALPVNHVVTIFTLHHSLFSHVVQCNRKFISRQQRVWLYTALWLFITWFFYSAKPDEHCRRLCHSLFDLNNACWREVGVMLVFVKVTPPHNATCSFEFQVRHFKKIIALCRLIKTGINMGLLDAECDNLTQPEKLDWVARHVWYHFLLCLCWL